MSIATWAGTCEAEQRLTWVFIVSSADLDKVNASIFSKPLDVEKGLFFGKTSLNVVARIELWSKAGNRDLISMGDWCSGTLR